MTNEPAGRLSVAGDPCSYPKQGISKESWMRLLVKGNATITGPAGNRDVFIYVGFQGGNDGR